MVLCKGPYLENVVADDLDLNRLLPLGTFFAAFLFNIWV